MNEKENIFIDAHNQFFQSLCAIAIKYCKDEQLAKDAVQCAFEKAWRSYKQLKDKTKFMGWLYTILINHLKEKYGQGKSRRYEYVDFSDFGSSNNTLSRIQNRLKENPIDRSELKLDLRNILHKTHSFSPQQQKIFKLRYMQDLTIEDVAKVLNISEGAVKKQLHRIDLQLNINSDYLKN